ncbi:MAG: hypothetical protein ACRERR_00625 [Moraxellaceae bacterium]
MKIITIEKIDLKSQGKTTTCNAYYAHVQITDVSSRAQEMINITLDTSWIAPLNSVAKATYEARSQRTIEKLTADIFNLQEDTVTKEFGEYMISHAAQSALETIKHKRAPLAELWKEKVIGNPGFDFHTESELKHISFGEAKYSGSSNPYRDALVQISDFIKLEKDKSELLDLQNFFSEESIENFIKDKKSYTAAFSINAKSPEKIIENAIKSENIDQLLLHSELFLIGIEVIKP